MSNGFTVQYSSDGNEVCIIPDNGIPVKDFVLLTKCFVKLGYKWWLPADERRGYIFAKEVSDED